MEHSTWTCLILIVQGAGVKEWSYVQNGRRRRCVAALWHASLARNPSKSEIAMVKGVLNAQVQAPSILRLLTEPLFPDYWSISRTWAVRKHIGRKWEYFRSVALLPSYHFLVVCRLKRMFYSHLHLEQSFCITRMLLPSTASTAHVLWTWHVVWHGCMGMVW